MKNLALLVGSLGVLWSAQASASPDSDTADLLKSLAQRPGVHVVMDLHSSLNISWTPYYRPAVEAINAQRLSSTNPAQVEKLAAYLNRPGNECTLKTLRSLADLLAKKGAQFDVLSKANFEAGTPNPQMPSLEAMQTIKVSGNLFFVGYAAQDKDDNDLVLFGCQPGTRGPDINGKLNCQRVRDDFDYAALVFKHPLEDVSVYAPTLNSASTLLGNGAATWNLQPHNQPMLQGMKWQFDGGGTISDLMESAFLDSLRATGQLNSASDFEGRCEVGSGLLAMLFGKSESDVKAGYKIP